MLKIPPAITGHCFPSGHATTETMRPASLIVIGHNPGGGPVMPRVPLVLTGPAGPSAPQGPGTGKVSGTGWTGPGQDRSGLWLRNAAAGLCVLAAAAAAVSFTAQYRMAETARHLPAVAALEAAIPDAAALVFACLGIALALHGRRALRARALNLASVGASVFMNAIAAAPGWRNLAIWVLPPVAYALASDTLIGVVRARALARHLQRHRAGRRRGHPAGRPRRPGPVAAAPGPGPRLHPDRVPRLGAGRVPGRPRPPRPGTRAGARAAPAEGDQDGPVPGPGHRTARVSRLHPARRRRRDQRRPRPPGRPAPRHRPRRPAQSRPGRHGTETPDDHQARHRPGRRAHRGRVRRVGVPARPAPARQPRPAPAHPAAPAAAPRQGLRPRLQPVPALVPLRGPAPLRPDPPARCRCATGSWTRASTRCSSAGRTTGTACASRSKSTCW